MSEPQMKPGQAWCFTAYPAASIPGVGSREISLVMPCANGEPKMSAGTGECVCCRASVWISPRADGSLAPLCYDCADVYLPGWRSRITNREVPQ